MDFLGLGHKFAALKPLAPVYKTERVPARPKLPSRTPSSTLRNGAPPSRVADAGGGMAVSSPATGTGKKRKEREISGGRAPRKAQSSKTRNSSSQRPLESDSDSDEEIAAPTKKVKSENTALDLKRSLKDQNAFLTEADDIHDSGCEMIHAADVMITKRRAKRGDKAGDRKKEEGDVVFLRYPSVSRKERYQLISGGEIIDPIPEELINPYEEIYDIAEIVKDEYMTEEQAVPFGDEHSGILRQVYRAKNFISKTLREERTKKSKDKAKIKELKDRLLEFKDAVGVYNEALGTLTKNGSLAKNLDNKHALSSRLHGMVLKQVYDRAISPQVELVTKYKNGTDYVFGELHFPFISRILTEDTGMKADQVFVDLGSGVGNVVIQAALQIGCESWGCEIMPNCCKLASIQKTEFFARCRAWGLSTGSVNLEEGNFLENAKIHQAMKRADVILVNNEVFNPALNQSLVDLFLDLKEGCKIVSLKSFVPEGHVINDYNQHNPRNLLQVEKKEFASGDVSWMTGGGNYYVATKDSSIIANYHKSSEERKTRAARAR
ncbi:hypothetical protein DSL72_009273 [Monilinia vaccinii-corymbosi]|uniref:Histone-lysine N-methyltransferase, H3 lysine-79 specific n=1 Tax=Monilinia vaccinii-corymbosi TaxID=61207 RepID=A0A8A3PQM3_9HELO|nr:hypothetical protein DSL72_009273 [Monilinia vaccinii-corymbosi]